MQGSGIVGIYCDGAANVFNFTGPFIGSNGFSGTAFFRGSHGTATPAGRISGQIQMPLGTVALTDSPAWEFSGSGNVWAKTTLAFGKAILGVDNALPPSAPVTFGQTGSSSGTIDLNGFNQTLTFLSTVNGANHSITNGSAIADSVFTFNGGASACVFDGRVGDSTRSLSLTISSGSLTLLGNNTFKGNTLVTGGTLALGAAGTLAATPLITLKSNATLDVSAKGAAGLSLASAQTLTGAGTVKGALTIGPGATLASEPAAGGFSVTGALALNGTNVAPVNAGSVPSTDPVTAASVTYGGTLVVQNLGPAFTAGASFKLFSAAAYSGAFTEIIPALPGSGLVWDTSKLAIDGTLVVGQSISLAPTNLTASVSGDMLTLSWPTSHTGWRLEAQTNSLSLGLSATWFEVPGSTTTNEMSFPIDASQPTVFYRLGYTLAP